MVNFQTNPCDVITADYTIIMSRTLKVMGIRFGFCDIQNNRGPVKG